MNALIENEIDQISKQSFAISNAEDLLRINAVLKGIKGLKKKIEDELNPEIEKAHKAHKGLTELKKKYLKPLEAVEASINTELKVWTLKQEEEARLLKEKIDADLARKAEEEKKRLLKEADGKDDWAKEVAQEKVQEIIPVTVDLKDCKETIAPKQEGQYKRSNWKARIVDESRIPHNFFIVDEKKLDKYAKEFKELASVTGVEFYDDFTIVTKV